MALTPIYNNNHLSLLNTIYSLFSSKFGNDNNYATSFVREKLSDCAIVKMIKKWLQPLLFFDKKEKRRLLNIRTLFHKI